MNVFMNLKKMGNFDVIKRNYVYLLLAQENGFFQDGYDEEDIATCSDWIIVWWIDELGDKKKDTKKFVQEILPNFKRWFSNGINSNGVGQFYDALKMAEINGIKIDNSSFDCISGLVGGIDDSLIQQYNSYRELSEHFITKEIFDNIKKFNKSGIPLCFSLANCYDVIMELDKDREKIDFDTFMFFHTAGYVSVSKQLALYDDKKYIEKNYEYVTCNADEVAKLMTWIGYGGYNSKHVYELEKRIKKYKEVICKNKELDRSIDRISKSLNKNVSLSYYELDDQGNKTLNEISGILLSCDENGITISRQNPETHEMQNITIEDNDRSLIARVSSIRGLLYKSRTLKEREMVQELKVRIGLIKSEDLLNKYIDKFGSIEGIAYLKKYASQFIEFVNPKQFPVDNLFTFCFENIAWISEGNYSINDVLQYVLYAYNSIMSEQFDTLKHTNFGYPINKFLSNESQSVIQNICNYVIDANLKDNMSEMPSTSMTSVSSDQQFKKELMNNPKIICAPKYEQVLEMPGEERTR